jgi:hypothetical protein
MFSGASTIFVLNKSAVYLIIARDKVLQRFVFASLRLNVRRFLFKKIFRRLHHFCNE